MLDLVQGQEATQTDNQGHERAAAENGAKSMSDIEIIEFHDALSIEF